MYRVIQKNGYTVFSSFSSSRHHQESLAFIFFIYCFGYLLCYVFKMVKADLRSAFVHLESQGKTRKEIAEFFGVSRKMVGTAVKRFHETGSNKNRPGSGRKKTATSGENCRAVGLFLFRDKKRKLRKLNCGGFIDKNQFVQEDCRPIRNFANLCTSTSD